MEATRTRTRTTRTTKARRLGPKKNRTRPTTWKRYKWAAMK